MRISRDTSPIWGNGHTSGRLEISVEDGTSLYDKWAWGNAVHPQEAGAISIGTDPPGVDFSFFNIIVVLSS